MMCGNIGVALSVCFPFLCVVVVDAFVIRGLLYDMVCGVVSARLMMFREATTL